MHTTSIGSEVVWSDDHSGVDWDELSELYRVAPLGTRRPEDLAVVFANSRYACFARVDGRLVGVGRALADGIDCSYIADVAVHPDHQGHGMGTAIMRALVRQSRGHQKVVLYASPGTEPFYERLGFLPMRTAMARFGDPEAAIASGILAAGR